MASNLKYALLRWRIPNPKLSRARDWQLRQRAIRSHERLRVWMAFPNDLFKDVPAEMTTRGRSFLFFAAGIFACTGLDKTVTLRVPENGLIALNVPLDQLRLGALSTRTTHPFYIARWNELVGILGISTKIENPYWDQTKGEMVASCANRNLLRRVIGDSMSCSSPTKGRWTGHGSEHCGFCLPCLIRRAAIKAGLGNDDPTTYTLADLTAQRLDTRRAEGRACTSVQRQPNRSAPTVPGHTGHFDRDSETI